MVGQEDIAPQDDEVILCVRYTSFLSWVLGVSALGIGSILSYGTYEMMLHGAYLKALVVVAGSLVMLGTGVEVLFTKHILFYRDRIVKVWHFLGQRRIPYAKAKLMVYPPFVQWLTSTKKAFRVKEHDGGGRIPLMQVPIMCGCRCISRETLQKVEAVLSCLVGLDDSSRLYEESRLFERSMLPKEVLSQDCRPN